MPASPFLPAARGVAAKYGIPEPILLRQVNEESGWNPRALSPAGAMGLLQLMPATARGLGVKNPYDPEANLDAGARYLRQQYDRFGNWKLALAAYNAGPGNVQSGAWRHIPETVSYVNNILDGIGAELGQGHKAARVSQQPVQAGSSSPAMSDADFNVLMTLADGGSPSVGQLLASMGTTAKAAPAPQETTQLAPGTHEKSMGGFLAPVADLTSVGGLHQTEGLPGYPAHDYFAPSGSAVVAPVTGRVIKLSGHDPAEGPVEGPHGPLGWSVYIQAADGHIYYLTHLGSRSVHLGQTIRSGQRIGSVADYARYGTPSHVHMGVH